MILFKGLAVAAAAVPVGSIQLVFIANVRLSSQKLLSHIWLNLILCTVLLRYIGRYNLEIVSMVPGMRTNVFICFCNEQQP